MLKVKCRQCGRRSDFSLHTEPLPSPYNDVAKTFLECPYCHLISGEHFLSPALIEKQVELRHAVTAWQMNKISLNFNRLAKIRKEYSLLFDDEQKKYFNFLESLDSLKKAITEHAAKL